MEFEFDQNEQDVIAVWALGDLTKRQIQCVIHNTRLQVVLDGREVFNDSLLGKIDSEESFWTVEAKNGANVLSVTLVKEKRGKKWRCLGKNEAAKIQETAQSVHLISVNDLDPDDDQELADKNVHDETILENRYLELKAEKGLQDEECLKAFFEFFDNGIQLYRLNQLSTHLEDVVPECRKRTDQYKLKGIQALAFVLWKQSKFREALPIFHEMEDILGKNAALCENIAHTYNSLGDYPKAEEYFREALKFCESDSQNDNKGGILLGLGLVRDRLGQHEEALPIVKQAYEFYKRRAEGKPASLQAKAGISVAKISQKLGKTEDAEKHIRESIMMYEITCGETSPLTASAYQELGSLLWDMRRREEAQKALHRAYEIETIKDAFDLCKVLEIHNLIMDTHLKEIGSIDRRYFKTYFVIAMSTVDRVKRTLPQDGNAAVYYKAVGELHAWGGSYEKGKVLIMEAMELLSVEKTVDCTNLVKQCVDMVQYCNRCLEGQQESPMTLEVPAQKLQETPASSSTSPAFIDLDETRIEEIE